MKTDHGTTAVRGTAQIAGAYALAASGVVSLLHWAGWGASPGSSDVFWRELARELVLLWVSLGGLFLLGRRCLFRNPGALSRTPCSSEVPAAPPALAREPKAGAGAASFEWDANPLKNLGRLAALAGERSGAAAAVYVRLEHDRPQLVGGWRLPEGFRENVDSGAELGACLLGHGRETTLYPGAPFSGLPADVSALVARHAYVKALVLPVRPHAAPLGALALFFRAGDDPGGTAEAVARWVALSLQAEELRLATLEATREQQEQHRTLVELSPVAVLVSQDEKITYANGAAARLLGVARAETLLNRPLLELLQPEAPDGFRERLRRVHLSAKELALSEQRFVRSDGVRVDVELAAIPFGSNGDRAVQIVARDITERKRAEEALRNFGSLYHSLVENLPQNVFRKDRQGRFTFANERFCQSLGRTLEEVLGKTDADFFPPELAEKYQRDDRRLIETGEVLETAEKHQLPDGVRLDVQVIKTPLHGADGRVVGIQGIFWDITERRQAEEELRKLSRVVEQTPASVMITDTRGGIEYVNPKFLAVTGYTFAEVQGRNPRFLKSGEMPSHEYQRLWEALAAGREWRGELHNRRKNGELFWELAVISAIKDEAGLVTHYLAVKEDITERKAAEEQIREQAALLNIAHDAVIVRDVEERVVFWNKGAERLYGWTPGEAVGRFLPVLIPQKREDFDVAKQAVLEKGEWSGELRQTTRRGHEVIVNSRWTLLFDPRGNPKSVLTINTDITERKRLEMQFLHAQRMESLGTLASGIAHDLNNILAPILMSTQILQVNAGGKYDQELLTTIETGAKRGADIVKQVLTFARGIGGERVLLQARHLIKEVVKIAQETFPKDITVKFKVPKDLWTVTGDATQLHQVLLNLAVNARDALPNGGILALSAENAEISGECRGLWTEARPGPYLLIQVEDTGTGIPAEIIDKIFDPFFTTKPHGKGTGLGLSTVLGIVKSHGGFVNVSSQPGLGTAFRVYLPAAPNAAAGAGAHEETNLPSGRGETVLVVDDEPGIRTVTQNILRKHGYAVLTAANGREAVALLSQNPGTVSIVLTDIMMPVMDGISLTHALKKIQPDLKIIASSGLVAEDKLTALRDLDFVAFLCKPYTAEQLLQALQAGLAPGSALALTLSAPRPV